MATEELQDATVQVLHSSVPQTLLVEPEASGNILISPISSPTPTPPLTQAPSMSNAEATVDESHSAVSVASARPQVESTLSEAQFLELPQLAATSAPSSVTKQPLAQAEQATTEAVILEPRAQTVPTLFQAQVLQAEADSQASIDTTDAELFVQAEAEAPLSEDTGRIDQTETIPDGSGAPTGDRLETVDGLDGSVVEEAESDEQSAPEVVEETEDGETANETDLQAPEPATENSDEFDVEEFEAEEFEFEADEDSVAPSDVDAEAEGDPDLGILRLRERPLPKKKSAIEIPVFLVGNLGSIGNANTLAGVDPVDDRLFRSGLSLIASPRLSKRTALIASVQGNRYRYDDLSRLNYNELRLQTNLRHVFTRRMYGDLGWTHRQLFLQDEGDRFLYEHAAFVGLTRNDPITKKTRLTSFYNLRASFADPDTSSRLRNTVGVSLRHNLTPALQASLTGRMTLTNFTQQSRQDFYSQGLAQLSYRVSKNFRLGVFGSLTRGNSSNRRVDFDNSTIGVSLSSNIRLF